MIRQGESVRCQWLYPPILCEPSPPQRLSRSRVGVVKSSRQCPQSRTEPGSWDDQLISATWNDVKTRGHQSTLWFWCLIPIIINIALIDHNSQYGYGSIPIDTFLVGYSHPSYPSIYQLFWGEQKGYLWFWLVLTHCHIASYSQSLLHRSEQSWGSHGCRPQSWWSLSRGWMVFTI